MMFQESHRENDVQYEWLALNTDVNGDQRNFECICRKLERPFYRPVT